MAISFSKFNVQFCSVNTGSISLIKKRTKTFRTEVKGHVVHSKFMVTIEVDKVKQWVKRPFSFPSLIRRLVLMSLFRVGLMYSVNLSALKWKWKWCECARESVSLCCIDAIVVE